MPGWQGSDRRQRLPDDWEKIRKRVLIRDRRRCTWLLDDGVRCGMPATDVDHIKPGDDHGESNLRSLCSDHHQAKSSCEGAAAKAANWRRQDRKYRRVEAHPGAL